MAHALQCLPFIDEPGTHDLDPSRRPPNRKERTMLYWAAVFFVLALIAAVFGFGGIAASAVGIAKILFFAFLVLAVISVLLGRSPNNIFRG